MDDTRSLDHDDLALLLQKNQSYGRSSDHLTKYGKSTSLFIFDLSSFHRYRK
jgi:hypothetical protein